MLHLVNVDNMEYMIFLMYPIIIFEIIQAYNAGVSVAHNVSVSAVSKKSTKKSFYN